MLSTSLKGSYAWQLFFDIDNSQNSGKVIREVEVTTSIVASYNDLKKSLESSRYSSSLQAALVGSYFDVVQASVKANVSTEIQSSYEKITEKRTEYKQETKKTDKYEVGAHSKLVLYRLVFNGPGVQYQTDRISSDTKPMDDVVIDVTVKQLSFLKSIDVIYTDDSASSPSNVIKMAHGDNGDINKRFRGKFVWLVPVWTTKVGEAATGIEIAIQKQRNANYVDLAKGAKGAFRYIKMLQRYTNNRERISDVGLWRSDHAMDLSGSGWRYKTIDINQGRKGHFLYLVWNTISV